MNDNSAAPSAATPKTLAEKVWANHLVAKGENGEPDLIYIDLHLVHEVTSPQAFDGLRLAGRPVRRPDLTIATEDHNTPTLEIDKPIADLTSRTQIEALRANCAEFGIRLHPLGDVEQGIVHVVGPQLGLTQPGITVVCGDSHTSTHGAFGAMALGIGTSEVEHVLATQTLPLKPFKTMAITVEGTLRPGVTAKDIILAVIAKIGTNGGQGYVLEYRGSAIRAAHGPAREPQPVEGLRARDLVDEVQIDVDEAVRDLVVRPDLVQQCRRAVHLVLRRVCCVNCAAGRRSRRR